MIKLIFFQYKSKNFNTFIVSRLLFFNDLTEIFVNFLYSAIMEKVSLYFYLNPF